MECRSPVRTPGAGPCGRTGRHRRPAARLACLLAAGEAPAPGCPRLASACLSAFLTTAAPRRHRHPEEESEALLHVWVHESPGA